MNFYLLSIIAFGVFVAILYLKSSEHQRMLYSQKYVRDKVSGTLGFDKFKEKADEMLQRKKELLALIHLDIDPYHDIVDIYGREPADNVLRILGTELNRRVVRVILQQDRPEISSFALFLLQMKKRIIIGLTDYLIW